jgi:hypothetical protein
MPSSHYDWLDAHFVEFARALNVPAAEYTHGLISAHGDKFYTYRNVFETAGLAFHEGVAIGLLSYISPYSRECRETEAGWVPVESWIIANKDRFLSILRGLETAPEPLQDVRPAGSVCFYEYHCLESANSSDAQLWYRSHQRVTVLGLDPDSDVPDIPTKAERADEGQPLVYRVRFADGHEGSVFEDELLDSETEYTRPDPPKMP